MLRHGDPIFPARELPAFDSKLEERFAKLTPAWDLLREPVALAAGDALIVHDFELRHRSTGESWLLEIAGYWTPDHCRRSSLR